MEAAVKQHAAPDADILQAPPAQEATAAPVVVELQPVKPPPQPPLPPPKSSSSLQVQPPGQLCPACGVTALTEEEIHIVRKPGRRSTRDSSDPRNRKENLVTREFLHQHIVTAGMSLRDIGSFHGYTISTLSRRAKQEGVPVGSRSRAAADNYEGAEAEGDGPARPQLTQPGAAGAQQGEPQRQLQRRKPGSRTNSKSGQQEAGDGFEGENGEEAEQQWQPRKRVRREATQRVAVVPRTAMEAAAAAAPRQVYIAGMPGGPSFLVAAGALPVGEQPSSQQWQVQPPQQAAQQQHGTQQQQSPQQQTQSQLEQAQMWQLIQQQVAQHGQQVAQAAVQQAAGLAAPPVAGKHAPLPKQQQHQIPGEHEDNSEDEAAADWLASLRHRSPAPGAAPPAAAEAAAVVAAPCAVPLGMLPGSQTSAGSILPQLMQTEEQQAAAEEEQQQAQAMEAEPPAQQQPQQQQPGEGSRQEAAAAAAVKAEPQAGGLANAAMGALEAQPQLPRAPAAVKEEAVSVGAVPTVAVPAEQAQATAVDHHHQQQQQQFVGAASDALFSAQPGQQAALPSSNQNSVQGEAPVAAQQQEQRQQQQQQQAGHQPGGSAAIQSQAEAPGLQGAVAVAAAQSAPVSSSEQQAPATHSGHGSPVRAPSSEAGGGNDASPGLAAVRERAMHHMLRQAVVSFERADDTSPDSMLPPLSRLLRAGKGGEALREVVEGWSGFPLERQQNLFHTAALRATNEQWEQLEADLKLELAAG